MSHAARDAVAVMATSAPEVLPDWDPASSIPTLTGSLLSLVATATVIVLWIFAGGRKRRDFRYALILNLTVAGTIGPRACRVTRLTSRQSFLIVLITPSLVLLQS